MDNTLLPTFAHGLEAPSLVDVLDTLVATASRAPSVHNSQPWLFRVNGSVLELRADPGRRLDRADPTGREMFVSCGAALFGLRLAVRLYGRRPVVELLPAPAQPDLLARVRLGAPAPLRPDAHRFLAALRRRHTHRGPFAAEPLPDGLLAALQRDAEAEGAALALVHEPHRGRLAVLAAAADRRQRAHPALSRELRSWTRPAGSPARDGVPARAFPHRVSRAGALAQRDFDLGRGWGTLVATGPDPAVTAVLITSGDGPADWLRAGQALHRLLLRAAGDWVFARLHSQALEIPPVRAAVRERLRLPGAPHLVLELGRARFAPLTPRRPVSEVVAP